MREIKFRVWDKDNNKFYEPTYEAHKGNLEEILMSPSGDLNIRTFKKGTHIEILNHESNFPDRFILMQYTGLKDKSGKEIYEGDLMTHWGNIFEVTFHNGSFGLKQKTKKGAGYGSGQQPWYLGDYPTTTEIIGNIYENPELIKT